jgi:hypothetical protein
MSAAVSATKLDEKKRRLLLKNRVHGMNVAHNAKVVSFALTVSSIAAGCAAGILGITGIVGGIVFYLVATLFVLLLLAARMEFNVSAHFESPRAFVTSNLTPGAMSFVLFWTMLYSIVNIY